MSPTCKARRQACLAKQASAATGSLLSFPVRQNKLPHPSSNKGSPSPGMKSAKCNRVASPRVCGDLCHRWAPRCWGGPQGRAGFGQSSALGGGAPSPTAENQGPCFRGAHFLTGLRVSSVSGTLGARVPGLTMGREAAGRQRVRGWSGSLRGCSVTPAGVDPPPSAGGGFKERKDRSCVCPGCSVISHRISPSA